MTYELPPVEDAAIWELWLSIFQLPAVTVAAELGIYESLRAGRATADELATRGNLDPRATRVLLDLLAALRLLGYDGATYELAPLGRTYLLNDSPYCWLPLLASVKHMGFVRPLQLALAKALRQNGVVGRPAQSWAEGSIDPELAATVSQIMHCHSLPAAVGVALHGNLGDARRVLDVGGGSGCFSIALAQRYPTIRCTVLELASVCTVAQRYIVEGGVADRVDTSSVDMFRSPWPAGYDAILMSNVMHDWDRARNAELAARAFAALPSGGRICLHEMLLDDHGPSAPTTAAFSMLMLLTNPGRQYQLAELRELLSEAGFASITAAATYGRYSLVRGTKP